jgi:hypothetical protein
MAGNSEHRVLSLDKMTIKIPDIRIAAISSESFGKLKELLCFRHFRRYYFEMEYDWDELAYLQKKFVELERPIKRDLECFHDFLKALKLLKYFIDHGSGKTLHGIRIHRGIAGCDLPKMTE